MKISVTPSVLSGEITAPPSKSYAHRYVIAAACRGKPVTIKNVGRCEDVIATVDCLKKAGADCDFYGDDFKFNSFTPVNNVVLDCKESGSTLRFLMPICAALGIRAAFTGSKTLLGRPLKELVDTLNEHGADIESFTVKGKIEKGEYKISGNVTSQYITGLLFALATIGGGKITVTGKIVSEPYIAMTVETLESFGADIENRGNVYEIKKGFGKAKENITVEGDYSGAAFFLTAAATGGKITVKGLKENSLQGDAEILSVLRKFGANVCVKGDSVTVEKRELNGITQDCDNIPDLVQIIAVAAAYAKGETRLKNVYRLKDKESDRIEAILKTLETAGIRADFDGRDLIIIGGKPKGGTFFTGNDHRSAMSAAILACYADGDSEIIGAESVTKSYPNFYKDFSALGGKCNVGI